MFFFVLCLDDESKINCSFMFPDSLDLSKEIWHDLKNNSKDRTKIIAKEPSLGEEKQKECEKIIAYALNLVSSEFDRCVSFSCIIKTAFGYSLRLLCSKSPSVCKSYWFIRISVINNVVNVTCTKPCNHLYSTVPSNAN